MGRGGRLARAQLPIFKFLLFKSCSTARVKAEAAVCQKRVGFCRLVPVLMLILDKSRANVEQLGWRTWPKFHPKIGCGTPRVETEIQSIWIWVVYQVLFGPPGIFHQRKKRDEVTASGNETAERAEHSSCEGGRRRAGGGGISRGREKKGICLRLSCVSCYPKRADTETRVSTWRIKLVRWEKHTP